MDFVQIISNVGFPIGCCIAMGIYINTTVKELTRVIEQNTQVISELCIRLKNDN